MPAPRERAWRPLRRYAVKTTLYTPNGPHRPKLAVGPDEGAPRAVGERLGSATGAASDQRVLPTDRCKAREVGVGRVERQAVFKGERGKLGVRDEVAAHVVSD